jgi:hypothetical protein
LHDQFTLQVSLADVQRNYVIACDGTEARNLLMYARGEYQALLPAFSRHFEVLA